MILSVSRRTDIPNYYFDCFFHRIKEGFLYVRNPMNPQQISKIDISKEVVDCIVFWTKNPEPMMERLEELKGYNYYFQFTLTGYGADIECKVPHKKKEMIPIFQKLSDKIGKEKVIWRYDPILFNKDYKPEYHLKAFAQIAQALKGYTEQCVISFVDVYTKNKKAMETLDLYELEESKFLEFAKKLSDIAKENGMEIGSCAETMDLENCGIKQNSCIDAKRIEKIIGCKIDATKDLNQRKACGCVESVEVGTYNTCRNGCKYCYAGTIQDICCSNYDPLSPLLCGEVMERDKITPRKVKSIRKEQISLWDE